MFKAITKGALVAAAVLTASVASAAPAGWDNIIPLGKTAKSWDNIIPLGKTAKSWDNIIPLGKTAKSWDNIIPL